MEALTVKELIDKLSEFNPNAEICFMYDNLLHPLNFYGWSSGDEDNNIDSKKTAVQILFTSNIEVISNDKDR